MSAICKAVLGQEQVGFEIPALRLIGQAAAGSMRDALSLTDKAIAYSAGNLTEEAVRGMLGTIDQRHLVRLLDALATGDAKGVLAVADELAIRGLSYAGALADAAVLLSRVAIEQRVTGVTPAEDPLAADISRLAQALHPDAVQLFYSVAVHSRGELTLAPDEYAGFIMACLRMLALNGEPARETALEAPAAPARQTADPPWPPPRCLDPAPVAAPHPQAAEVEASVAPALAPVVAPESAAPAQPAPTVAPQAAASQAVARNPACLPRSHGGIRKRCPVVQAAPAGRPSLPPRPSPRRKACRLGRVARCRACRRTSQARRRRSLAVTPAASAVTAPAPAQDEPDGPPSWVDEKFPTKPKAASCRTAASRPIRMTNSKRWPARRHRPRRPPPRRSAEAPPTRKRSPRPHRRHDAGFLARAGRAPAGHRHGGRTGAPGEWVGVRGDAIVLRVAVKTLAESESRVRLQTVLCEHFGQGIRLDVDVGAVGDATAHAVAQAERAARQQAAEDAVAVDPFVQAWYPISAARWWPVRSATWTPPPPSAAAHSRSRLSSGNIAMMKDNWPA